MDIPITIGCRKCGSCDISIPSESKNSIVTCNSCQAILGKWGHHVKGGAKLDHCGGVKVDQWSR